MVIAHTVLIILHWAHLSTYQEGVKMKQKRGFMFGAIKNTVIITLITIHF